MALVTCPECGKEKVSDLAEACPECGFPIKSHFANLETPEITNKFTDEEPEPETSYGVDDFLIDNKDEYKPQKPNIWTEEIFPNLLLGVLAFAAFLVQVWIFDGIVDFLSNLFLIIGIAYLIGYIIKGIIGAFKYMDYYNEQLKKWEENPVQFFKDEQEKAALREEQEREAEKRESHLRSAPTVCPKCGGTSFTPVRKKWDIVTGYRTNKIELICDNCGNRIDARK